MVTANNDDYLNMQKLLDGTCYQSLQEYKHDWFFMDYFYNISKNSNTYVGIRDPRDISGVDLLSDIVYMIQTTSVSATNVIYVFQTFQRHLVINNKGVFLDGN